jgi:hypothetical protein
MVRVSCVLVETAQKLEPRYPAVEARIAVYDGRKHLGDIAELGRTWIAFEREGTSLGLFPNRKSATSAVIAGRRL